MGLDNIKCFRCQEYGHLERDCPQITYAAELDSSGPPWCGICDQRTRQIWLNADGTSVQRCPRCHRPGSRGTSAQHRRCPECKTITYHWDNEPCGSHLSPAAPDKRLPIERIREITRSNS